MNDNITNCPNCPNHCPKDNIKCGRGRQFFGVESNDNNDHKFFETQSKNPLVQKLVKVAAIADHKSQMMTVHNVDDSTMFNALSLDEQNQLNTLLDKQMNAWVQDHARHHHE